MYQIQSFEISANWMWLDVHWCIWQEREPDSVIAVHADDEHEVA